MVANLYGARFYSFREPAWHQLGLVLDEPLKAVPALFRVGFYSLKLERCYTTSGIELEENAIIRDATHDDPFRRSFGIVGPDYELLTPLDVCQAFDWRIDRDVETLGALGRGETLFISTKLPSWNIHGDDVDNYLIVEAPMNGGAAVILKSHVRVVCQNTLSAAKSSSSAMFRVKHNAGVKARFSDWLEYAWGQEAIDIAEYKPAFELFSKAIVPQRDVQPILETVYPLPKLPKKDAPPEILEARLWTYEQNCTWSKSRRSLAEQLFEGAGVGQDTPAAKGTAWGLFNAVAEVEDYAAGTGSASHCRETIFGSGANYKRRAFDVITERINQWG
jgi:hypothetical protein